jgi:hypothetical protein
LRLLTRSIILTQQLPTKPRVWLISLTSEFLIKPYILNHHSLNSFPSSQLPLSISSYLQPPSSAPTMSLSLQRNQGNDFLWNEIVEELAFRKLQLDLQILRECTENCNCVWIAYTILSLKAVSNRLQTCYCGTSRYVPKPIGHEQAVLRLQRSPGQGSADTHQLVVSTESHGNKTLSNAQFPVKPVGNTAIRSVIPLNFAALHPPASRVVLKKDGFKLSATSAPFVPSSDQNSSSRVIGGEDAAMDNNFMPLENDQLTFDEPESKKA